MTPEPALRDATRYVIYEDHVGWVITTADDYELLQGIYRAMRAKTWGEFMTALPEAERERLLDEHPDLFGPPGDPDEAIGGDEDRLSAGAPFDAESLPGFSDGDYPPWPAEDSQVSDGVCREAYDRFGKREAGFIHTFHHLHDGKLADLQAWLESLGHTLERRESPNA